MNRQSFIGSVVMDSSVDLTITGSIQVPQWARYGALYIPNITNAAVTIQIMEEKDAASKALLGAASNTNWVAYADEAESTQIAASGVENTWIDMSHMIKAMPANCFVRFVQGAAETGGAPLTYRVSFRGA